MRLSEGSAKGGKKIMRKAKVLKVCLLTLMVGIMSVSLAWANGSITVDGLLDESYSDPDHYPGGGGLAPGDLFAADGNGTCYYAFVVDRAYNDNVYSSNDKPYREQDGWPKGHGFGDLEESDYGQFTIDCPGTENDTTVYLDYLRKCTDPPYKSGQGTTDDTGHCSDGYPAPINEAATSLYWNMTSSGWDGVATGGGYNGDPEYHSPPYDWNDTPGQYWEWYMIYEFSMPKFAGQCCAVTQAGAHNSPAKYIADLATLGDYVWIDEDDDSLQDPGESGLGNVTVRLYDSGGTLVRTTQTDPTGHYLFVNLSPGDYYVQFVLPTGYWFVDQDANGNADDTFDSDADPSNDGKTVVTTLTSGENDLTWDAGLEYVGGSITVRKDVYDAENGGSAFEHDQDFNYSGDLGEFTLDDFIGSTETVRSITFSPVNPGTYQVTEALPQDWDIRDLFCTEDVSSNSIWLPGTTYIDIQLDPLETVVCTFQNFPTGDPTSVVVSSLAASHPDRVPILVGLGVASLGVVGALAFARRRRRAGT
jgi:hypothetical protein